MKDKTFIFIFLVGILSILGNIFYNPTSTTIVESNTYLTPANPAFDDDNFYKCITDRLGVSEDTNVTDEQLSSITYIHCGDKEITSVKGLEKLTGLTNLNLRNNQLTSIDVSNNTALTDLYLYNNQITSIDVSNNTELRYLQVDENVEVIGVSDNVDLLYVPLYLFSNYDLKFSENDVKPGTYEYTVNVSNSIDKLSAGFDVSSKGFYYNCPDDNTLCGGYYL